MSNRKRKGRGKGWRTAALIAVASVIAVAVLFARRRVGVSMPTALADAFTVSGGAISLPLLLAYLYSTEGADGFSYAAWRGVLGVFPVFGREQSYREYKKRCKERRGGRQWDLTAVKVGGMLCLTGLTFAIFGMLA